MSLVSRFQNIEAHSARRQPWKSGVGAGPEIATAGTTRLSFIYDPG
jgi:hypothetical protein